MQTSAPDLLLAAYNALTSDEQEQAFQRLTEARLDRLADQETELGRHLRSLQRVARYLEERGEQLTTTAYRRAWRELKAAGEADLINLSAICRFFGSFAEARRALDLSAAQPIAQIQRQMSNRRLGRVHQYSRASLRKWLEEAIADLGLDQGHPDELRPPQCREFLDWRKQRRALAEAQGQTVHIPTAAPYRRLTTAGTWAAAMRALDFTPEEVAARPIPTGV